MNGEEAYSIGQVAELTGMPVKTIRYYADVEVAPASARSENGHRRYDAADVARLQLARSLRELDLDLASVREVLEGRSALDDILHAHLATLETRMQELERRRAVVRLALTSPAGDTSRRLRALTRREAAGRRDLLESFWGRVLGDEPAPEALRLMSRGMPELPADPTAGQLDAWLELMDLAADEDFIETTRRNARRGERPAPDLDPDRLQRTTWEALTAARSAVQRGEAPEGPVGREVAARLGRAWAEAAGADYGPAYQRRLVADMAAHTDPRAVRYWELVAAVRGEAPVPLLTAAGEWLQVAMAASAT